MTLFWAHTVTRALRYVLVLFYTRRMGFLPNGTWVIDTLGDMIEQGSSLSAYCGNRPDCGRALDLDVYDLAIQFGRRWKHVERKPPVRCSRCGSRDLHWIMSPDTLPLERARESEPSNFRPSRTPEERAALALIFPRRWEWPARGD